MDNEDEVGKKTPAIEVMLEGVGQLAYGTSRAAAKVAGTCVCCKKPAGEFRDELSAREFRISGLCQVCQDAFFEMEAS
jgi:hypothetical protein